MALPNETLVWEFRPTVGDNDNGGAFLEGASGVDLTQQDSPEQAYTDLVIDAADNTKITSAAERTFIADDIGNCINITGGTGFTTGRYYISAVAAGVATLDRAVGTTSSTGGTGNLGGALNKVDATFISAHFAHGYAAIYWVKATGTMTPGSGWDFGTLSGGNGGKRMIGYSSTRGDNPTGTDRPLIDMEANDADADNNTSGYMFKNLRFTGSGTYVAVIPNYSTGINCKFTNTGGSGKYAVLIGGPSAAATSTASLIGCEMDNSGGYAVGVGTSSYVQSYLRMVGCFVHDSAYGIIRVGSQNWRLFMHNSVIKNISSTGIVGTGSILYDLQNNVFFGAETPAGNCITSITAAQGVAWYNNIFYGWSTVLTITTANYYNYVDYNCFYNNTTNDADYPAGDHDFAVDPEFEDAANNDFRIGSATLIEAGFPGALPGGHADCVSKVEVGAIQAGSGGGGGASGPTTNSIGRQYPVKGC